MSFYRGVLIPSMKKLLLTRSKNPFWFTGNIEELRLEGWSVLLCEEVEYELLSNASLLRLTKDGSVENGLLGGDVLLVLETPPKEEQTRPVVVDPEPSLAFVSQPIEYADQLDELFGIRSGEELPHPVVDPEPSPAFVSRPIEYADRWKQLFGLMPGEELSRPVIDPEPSPAFVSQPIEYADQWMELFGIMPSEV